MTYHFFQLLLICTILVIDIKIVPLKEIISYINIHPVIVIYIGYHEAQSKTNNAPIYARNFTNILKYSSIVAV